MKKILLVLGIVGIVMVSSLMCVAYTTKKVNICNTMNKRTVIVDGEIETL